jgi:MFS family permease
LPLIIGDLPAADNPAMLDGTTARHRVLDRPEGYAMAQQEASRTSLGALRALPRSVWALGVVSLLMDTSSELIHSLLPAFLVTVLGADMLTVGLIEGIAEATAAVTKAFSGAFSDWLGKRKLPTLIGYGLAALSKPLFPLALSVGWVLLARFADRVGKGIRGAPRDALIGDLTPPPLRGAAFGLRQSLDTVGAFLGPLAALGLMARLADDFRAVFWVAAVPAALCVIVLAVGVEEPSRPASPPAQERTRLSRAAMTQLGRGYWLVVLIAAVFSLARFGEAFLLVRAQRAGLPVALVPLVLVAMNVVYALAAFPAGHYSDGAGRRPVLIAGFAVLILADLVLGFAGDVATVMIGVALWGLHMALTQGLLSAMVADTAPARWRGTAFGLFNLISGAALLLASLIAGELWDRLGPAAPFFAGGGVTAAALLGLAVLYRPSASS